MKFIKWLFILLGLLIISVLVVAAFLPKVITISAEADINLPRVKVFHAVASFNDRPLWDPWISMDSTTKTSVDFHELYTGSQFSWTGRIVGTGEITVDSTKFGHYIASTVHFAGENAPAKVTWSFQGEDSTTHVTWTFSSPAKYPLGRLALSIMEKQIRKSYVQGLKNLKKHLETNGVSLSSLSTISIVQVPSITAMVAAATGPINKVTSKFDALFKKVTLVIADQDLEVTGVPFSYYFDYNENTQQVTVYCGIPVRSSGKPAGDVLAVEFPPFRAIKAVHTGPYDELMLSYEKMMKYIQTNKLKATKEVWEFYLTDPQVEPIVTSWKTEIYMPVM